MKIKKEYIILGVIIIALSLYLVFHNANNVNYKLPEIEKITVDDITKIEYTREGETITLEKRDDNWFIQPNDYPADSQIVEEQLKILEELTLTALVTETENYKHYELDDRKISVKAWVGESLKREFEIGKLASSRQHTFVKLTNQKGVFQARENVKEDFDKAIADLRDKIVMEFTKEDINRVELNDMTTSVVFNKQLIEPEGNTPEEGSDAAPEKSEYIWVSEDGKNGDKAKIDRIVSTMAKLNCEEYIENKTKDSLTNPIYTIKVSSTSEYALSVYEKIGEDNDVKYSATASTNEYPFYLTKWGAENIQIAIEESFEKPKEGEVQGPLAPVDQD